MAAFVEQILPSGYFLVADPTATDQNRIRKLKLQNAYLAFFFIRDMLKSDGVQELHCRLNTTLFTHEVVVESGVRDVLATIEKACTHLKPIAEEEMESLLDTFDMTDTHLCSNYQRVSKLLMTEKINFGRIVSLFFFTYVLCKRLHNDCRSRVMESVVEWLTEFLCDTVNPWLLDHHQGKWVSL